MPPRPTKLFLLIGLVLGLVVPRAPGQGLGFLQLFKNQTTTGPSQVFTNDLGAGKWWVMNVWPTGTVTSCLLQFEISTDGTNWSVAIPSADTFNPVGCDLPRTIAVSGFHRYIRANLTTLTGGGSVSAVLLPFSEKINTGLDPFVAPENTTTTTLGPGGTFTGGSRDILNFPQVQVSVSSDVASALNGLVVEGSIDNLNWFTIAGISTIPGQTHTISAPTEGRFVRVRYTNGASPQTFLRLQTILRPMIGHNKVFRLSDELSAEVNAPVSKTVILAQKEDSTDFKHLKVSTHGGLVVATCSKSTFLDLSGASTTEIVSAVSGKTIRVCAFILDAPTALTVRFVQGTGTNCGTGTSNLTSLFDFSNKSSPISHGSGVGIIFVGSASQALCVTKTGSGSVGINISYDQF